MNGTLSFRPADAVLLERLENESLLEATFRHHAGVVASRTDRPTLKPPPRAAGLVAAARQAPGGSEAVAAALAGDLASFVRFIEEAPLETKPPELLHHLALYHAHVAEALEASSPEAAAHAWTRSLAAWIALGEERTYLAALSDAVLGPSNVDAAIPPERVVLEVLAELGGRAEAAARALAPEGRAALLALSLIDDASRLAGASEEAARRARVEAERRRNAAVEAALAAVLEALEDATARAAPSADLQPILRRAIAVWHWSGSDEAVEHLCVDRLAPLGWELYRARRFDALRALLDDFEPLIESLAARIERDSSKLAYAAGAAQMYVFLSEIATVRARKLAYAERAVRLCPSHRNGRLVLSVLLCEEAVKLLRGPSAVVARRADVDRAEQLLDRAAHLCPGGADIDAARAMLERRRRGILF